MEINNGTRSIYILDDMSDWSPFLVDNRIAIELPKKRIGLNKKEVLLLRDELNKLLVKKWGKKD